MGSHVEYEHDPFIKWVNRVDPNMTQTYLTSTHDLFINRLVVLGSRVVSDFATPNTSQTLILMEWSSPNGVQWSLKVITKNREIIVYSRNTINVYSLLSHEWWIPLIKFMVGPTIYVRGGNTHLWYSEGT